MSNNQRQRHKEKMILQIVLAAEYLFGTLGHRGTSIQRVADEVGISKQALMHHFPTKQVLCDAVFANVLLFAKEFLGVLLLGINQPKQEEQLGLLIQKFMDRPYWAQFLLRELLEGRSAELPDSIQQLQYQYVEHLRKEQTLGNIVADLDIEATLGNLNLLLLSTLATLEVTPLPRDGEEFSSEEWMYRRLREVFRLYRITLFAHR